MPKTFKNLDTTPSSQQDDISDFKSNQLLTKGR